MKTKLKIVDTIPGTDKQPRGAYQIYWKAMRKTPKTKFLEVTAKPKIQHLISHYIYYTARKSGKKVSISFKPTAMYAFWK